jgi:tungstate transport system permease protein
MNDLSGAMSEALRLISTLDQGLVEIVALSLRVSLSAVAIAALIGIPLGAILATTAWRGRRILSLLIYSLMGLPPVVVGLLVYLVLSTSGPMGSFQLLYTPTAMIIAQTLLVTPIIASLTRQSIADLRNEYDEQLRALGISEVGQAMTLVYEARASLATALLAGFGRAIAEVGAVIIVGGNIDHVTRTMTTAIALETSKGELALALGLGVVLIIMSLSVNALVLSMRGGPVPAMAERS